MTIIDNWSGADHKDTSRLNAVPDFVTDENDIRRLTGYAVFQAYIETVARETLPPNGIYDPEDWQEFGDAAVIVDRIAAAVLGEDPTLGVVGGDETIPPEPDLDRPPRKPPEGLEPEVSAVFEEAYQAALALYVDDMKTRIEEWTEAREEAVGLEKRQDWIRDWADDDRFLSKVKENEHEHVVPLGDGVIVLGWDAMHRRPKSEILEPDGYFPVLDDSIGSQFPDKVHLAWQYSTVEGEGDDAETVQWVRRVTYELVPLEELGVTVEPPKYLKDAKEFTHACLLSDGVWKLDDFETVLEITKNPDHWNVQRIETSPGVFDEVELFEYVTGLDFIPVVHIPNTLASTRHFGRSPLVRLLQLLDEVAGSDADESFASRYAANPIIGASGMNPGSDRADMTPGGGLFRLADNGRLSSVDMAPNLEKLGLRIAALLKRLSVNSKVPEGLLGRVDASEVPSGIAMTLSFTPFTQLINDLREARSWKYSLALKMVQRIAIQNDDETIKPSTDVYPAELRFGTFMPQDLLGLTDILKRLIDAGLISAETAILMLQEAGVPSDDLARELALIRSVDGVKAGEISDAVGDSRAGAEYMGLEQYTGENANAQGPDPNAGPDAGPTGNGTGGPVRVDPITGREVAPADV